MTPARPPIRVLVVDDTVVVRRLVTNVLDEAADIEVVGTAANGRIALQRIEQLRPDLVTLDVEMPVMDGLETLAALRRDWPRLPVIMFSTLTERGASATLEALALGANDYVTKPSNSGSREEALAVVRDTLVPLVRLWGRRGSPAPAPAAAPGRPGGGAQPQAVEVVSVRPSTVPPAPVGVLAIGVSTGGPNALAEVMPSLSSSFPVPIVIVQHMPPVFTRMLAERLDATCSLHVVEAAEGDVLRPGLVLVAPGGAHLVPRRRGADVVATLSDAPPERSCRPAVDVTFRACAEVWGPGVLAVVLTGMGSDGCQGARTIVDRGGRVLVQDETTSVVWGMPGQVARAGLAEEILPLERIAEAVTQRASTSLAGAR